jgi:hypothetical protein
MAKQLLIAIPMIFLLLTVAMAESPCKKIPEDYFLYDTVPQAKDAGVDYVKEMLAAFRKDPKGLHIIFRVSSHLDGAGAQTHAEVLFDLLKCWGDMLFSEELSKESKSIREKVIRGLDFATIETGGYAKSFPLTYGMRHWNFP